MRIRGQQTCYLDDDDPSCYAVRVFVEQPFQSMKSTKCAAEIVAETENPHDLVVELSGELLF